ncbi:alpha/beta hydrolase [Jiangella sp. DSM 45060]|uniref:alpha/beta hydrolase n=1 Tax=Jiangella sp. DSM 45060 TaxID=1798224 RepID=UPI00087C0E3B|nr:hypothetical protein [Jiangella sp. DSM 45060]SDT72207.1 hypothetical protein SAMN04515669_6605 [Jiangella sp. DSM 45060]
MRGTITLLLLLGLVLTGCSGDERDGDGGGGPTPTSPYQEIEFTGGDGQPREGRLYGQDDAPVGVVLSHMGSDGDSWDDWAATAQALAERGHRVVTYQRLRPRYQVWQEIVGAVEYLRDNGAERVVVAGASLGAMASLHVALEPEPPTDAVVWIAGLLHSDGLDFDQATVAGLACPALLVSGDQDSYGGADATEQLHAWLPSSELLILPSARHGTDILADGGAPAEQLEAAVLDFVDTVAAAETTTPC